MLFSNSDNEDMLQLPEAKVFTFLQLRPQKESVPKMVLKVIKDSTLPTKLHQAQLHTKEWGLQVNYCQIITTSQSILSSSPYETEILLAKFWQVSNMELRTHEIFIAQIQ